MNANLSKDVSIMTCSGQKVLYEKYAPKMMGVSLRYCNSKMEAEDVLQDAFIKIFNKINTFKGKVPLKDGYENSGLHCIKK